MSLTEPQKRHLRKLAHPKKPVVLIGANGLSEAVLSEIDQALEHHELIKVRLNAEDREARGSMVEAICDHCRAQLVQRIGHVGIFYRPAKKPRIKLPA